VYSKNSRPVAGIYVRKHGGERMEQDPFLSNPPITVLGK
ncbi:uncharacterized, partial [Tachysurus ichikawai]